MEEIIGGAILGSVLTALFPKASEDLNKLFRPVAKAAVGGLYGVTSAVMQQTAETTETFKDLWAEAQAEAEAKRNAAKTVAGEAKSVKIDIDDQDHKKKH